MAVRATPPQRRRNDASGANHRAAVVVQADDPVFGSWAVQQRPGEATGTLYRYDGRGWAPTGPATWNAARGRFELPGAVAPEVRRALTDTVLAVPSRRAALEEHLGALVAVGFRGTRPPAQRVELSPFGALAYRSMEHARCLATAARDAEGRRPGRGPPLSPVLQAIQDAYLAADAREPVDRSAATFRRMVGQHRHAAELIERFVVPAPRGKPETLSAPVTKLLDALFRERYVAIERDTPGRTRWYRRVEGEAAVALDVARAVLREVCDAPAGTVEPGSECDRVLDAIEQEREPSGECAAVRVRCPHRISDDQRTEWRIGGMPPLGPYETTDDHAPGSVACCFYHPVSQERLRLQAQVGEDPETPHGSRAWVDAVNAHEQRHPMHGQWAACDLKAEAEVGGLPTGRGQATAGVMQLFRAFVNAHERANTDEALVIFGRLEPLITLHSDFDAMWALDNNFWDTAHLEAHESGNPAHVMWAHQQMKARGLTIHHAMKAKAKPRRKRNDTTGRDR